jgi:hypothetical protein
MDPKVLTYLANLDGLTGEEVEINNCLIRMYVSGFIDAKWEDGEPLFSLSLVGNEEYLLAYAYEQPVIEE